MNPLILSSNNVCQVGFFYCNGKKQILVLKIEKQSFTSYQPISQLIGDCYISNSITIL